MCRWKMRRRKSKRSGRRCTMRTGKLFQAGETVNQLTNMQTEGLPGYNHRKLFLLGVLALATTGIGFSIRGNIGSLLQTELFDPIDKLHSASLVGAALGVVFLGFAFTIAIGSPLLDYIGMGRLLALSSTC